MTHNDQRKRLRAVLAGPSCISPASVFDPLSARIAEATGYQFGFLAGSVAAATTLAAPDLTVLTLTELCGQVRRMMCACGLSLIVDADHGYDNALNVMRTVQELEHAGASALIIEDTNLPLSFGEKGARQELVSIEEGVGKLRAAVHARTDPALVVVARTSLRIGGMENMLMRARAYARTGIDAFFVAGGLKRLDQLEALRAAIDLPIMLGVVPPALRREDLAARRARILLQGHQPLAASLKAMQETYAHLYAGRAVGDLAPGLASEQDIEQLVGTERYSGLQRDYLCQSVAMPAREAAPYAAGTLPTIRP